MDKTDIRSLSINEMEELCVSLGEKAYRGEQLFKWVNKRFVSSFKEMTDISKTLKSILDEKCCFTSFFLDEKFISKRDDTIKYLFIIDGDNIIESVSMNYSFGHSVCISSQAGCGMGCTFCASAAGGLERNLTAGEMCAQVYEIQKDLGSRVSRVTIMGGGEPLANYDNVVKFIRIINSSQGADIGQRHITVSTCGLVPEIYRLADESLQITLAISLHAPNDQIRRKLMPVAVKYSIDEVLEACRYYFQKTKRRVTYEYALIPGVNDSIECAAELGSKLRQATEGTAHINLISVNNIKTNEKKEKLEKQQKENMEHFAAILKSQGIESTIRRKLGSDINAACGQLRLRKKVIK